MVAGGSAETAVPPGPAAEADVAVVALADESGGEAEAGVDAPSRTAALAPPQATSERYENANIIVFIMGGLLGF